MSFIGSFALREFRRIIRHKGFLFLVFLWPLLYAFVFGRIYSARVITKLPVVLVDDDRSQLSRLIIRYLEASRSFQVVSTLENPEEMQDILANNEAMVGLVIPRHLERNIKRGKPERVIAFVNASNLSIGNLANSDLRAVVGTVSAGIQMKYLMKTGSSSAKAQQQMQAVKIEAARLYNPGFNYLSFLAPGL
ncbi:MAG: ABC transporter permease, partial [Acidobacteriota bacterium]